MGAKGYAGLAAVGLLVATLSACGNGGDGGSDIAPVDVQSDNSDFPARYGLYVEAEGVLGRLDVAKSAPGPAWESLSNLPPRRDIYRLRSVVGRPRAATGRCDCAARGRACAKRCRNFRGGDAVAERPLGGCRFSGV